MSIPDDPFAHDPDRTVIRPTPGRRTETPAAPRKAPPPAPSSSASEPGPSIDLVSVGVNPIVAAASPLIALAVRIRGTLVQNDVPALRDRIVRELKRFDQKLRSMSVPLETVRSAHYALCAMLDDLVLNTPWGTQSHWNTQTLVSVFHNEVTGGDRFFDILRQLRNNPAGGDDLLELMYLCLSLGFEGRLRVLSNGPAELTKLRDGLFATIRQRRGDFERELSPHWQGIQAAHKPLSSKVPIWVFGLASAAILMAVFIGFSFAVSNASNPVFAEIARLPPVSAVAINSGTALPKYESHIVRLREFLSPEISRGIVEVKEDERTITVSIRGNAAFPVGSASLLSTYATIVGRVGEALETEPGTVTVSGHTDSTPIHTIRFPSNYELSLARAEAARDAIRTKVSDPVRIVAEGRADTEPVAGNDTLEGRERNRRIEITILKPLAG